MNPFDSSVPGYQLNPLAEMTIKRRLIADESLHVTPATNTTCPGYAYIRIDANNVCVGSSYHAAENGQPLVTTARYWKGNISGSDYVVRAANLGVEISFSGQSRFATGDIAFLLVEADHTAIANGNESDLVHAADYVFSHPRAVTNGIAAFANSPARVVVPIEDELRYKAWKPAVQTDPSPDAIHSTFETNVPSAGASPSNFGFRSLVIAIRNASATAFSSGYVVPSFRLRIVADVEYRGDHNSADGGESALQRYHATQSPRVAPSTAHSIMEKIGHYAGVVGEVLSHPVFRQGFEALGHMPMPMLAL
jgi:hypothetical protein